MRPWVLCTATASRTSRSRRSVSAGEGSWSPRASSARSPTRSVSSWSWTRTSSTRTERSSSLSSSMRRITSRFVRRLVSGVRSSCDASSTSWLWARREDSSASRRRLKVRRRRPSSSGPPGESRRETSVVSATSSTESVSEFSGMRAVRATSQPRATARRTPTNATISSRSARVRSSELTLRSVAICSAPPSRRMPDWTVVPAGRCSTYSRIWFPSTVTVVKKAGASPTATRRTCPVTGRPPPETTAPLVSITWPSVAVVVPISWPARTRLRRRGERVVRRLQQGVAGHEEGGQRGGQHGDDDGHRGGQHEPGAEGHASRST